MVKLHAIYQTNVVRLSDDKNSGTGIFPLTSRINHSCISNLQIHYIPATQTLVAHAVRHIIKGEELTINYSRKVRVPCTQRSDVFGRWGFKCLCRVCTGTQFGVREERHVSMLKLEYDLAAFDEPDRFIPHVSTPRTPQKALELGEDLLLLLKAEGIADQGLQSA